MFAIIKACFLPVLRIFLQIGVGYATYKFNWLKKDAARDVAKYTVNILLPMYIFVIMGKSMDASKLGYLVPVAFNYFCVLGAGYLISIVALRVCKVPPYMRNSFRACIMFGNNFLFPIVSIQGMCESYGFFYNDV